MGDGPRIAALGASSVLVAGVAALGVAEYLLAKHAKLSLTAVVDRADRPHPGPQGIAVVAASQNRLAAAGGTYDLVFWVEGPGRIGTSTKGPGRGVTRLEAEAVIRACDLIVGDPRQVVVSPDNGGPAATVSAYQDDLLAAGLVEPRVIDVTTRGWLPFFSQSRRYFAIKTLFRQIDKERMEAALDALPGGRRQVELHVVASAKNRRSLLVSYLQPVNTTYEPSSREPEYIEANRGFSQRTGHRKEALCGVSRLLGPGLRHRQHLGAAPGRRPSSASERCRLDPVRGFDLCKADFAGMGYDVCLGFQLSDPIPMDRGPMDRGPIDRGPMDRGPMSPGPNRARA